MTTSRSLSGGRKKRGNGHKMNCGCPICKNMRKSKKRGGADDIVANEVADDIVAAEVADDVAEVEDDELWDVDGGRRRRKHKKSCKRTRRHKKSRKSRKSRRHRRH
jgi:hypothetical protein